MRNRRLLALFLVCAAFTALAADHPSGIHGANGIMLPLPPPTEAKPVTDTVDGKPMNDPYRWLENGDSPETRAWIQSQMQYTQDYLSQVKIRPEIAKRLTE